MSAPDYVEPLVGWRVWHVVASDGELRLRSPLYPTCWMPGHEVVAVCRGGVESSRLRGGRRHPAPHASCGCGIYAGRTAEQAVRYLGRLFRRPQSVLHGVLGRVSLWGVVVECEGGWRASHAYPAAIFVPTRTRRRLSLAPQPSVEEIALALADYGVPVEIVDGLAVRHLVGKLDPLASPRR